MTLGHSTSHSLSWRVVSFLLSFLLDYIIGPWMAQPPTRLCFVSFLSFHSFYCGLFVIAQQSSHI